MRLKNMVKAFKIFLSLSLLFIAAGCSSHPGADAIIDKAIEQAGGQKFKHSRITFTFRDRKYEAEREGGTFVYQRIFTDSTGEKITDRLTNDGFTRTRDGRRVSLPDSSKKAYTNSVNSVIYFALLPYKLNDPAVQKSFLGTSKIKGEPYYQIGVTFKKQGGGQDFQDHFVYWIHSNTYTLDYLAYNFEENGGGTRFRAAKNIRTIKGIRFADYTNFKGLAKGDSLETYDKLYELGDVQKVSEINLKNISVTILNSGQHLSEN